MARIKSQPLFLGVALLALLLGACSADSPTEPQQTPVPPSQPPLGQSVTITADPNALAVGSTTPSTITVRATRSDGAGLNGTLEVTTDLGGFGSVGGPSTTQVTLVNGVGQAFFFPGNTPGIATLRVRQTGSTAVLATTTITIGGQVVFFLSSVSPGSGSAAGGEVVTINGGGFEGPVRVLFGGTPAEVLSVSPNAIRVRTPVFLGDPGTSGAPVAVTVTINLNETNQASDTLPNGFTYTSGGGGTRFLIASVTPTNGPNEGGTRVTITGDGFEAPVQVTFGDATVNLEAPVESVTRTQIVVRSPAASGFGQPLQNSSVSIRVRNLNSGLSATLANAFRYGNQIAITSIAPNIGPVTGGTRVTIFGVGFDEPVQVKFGDTIQQVVSVTGTEIVVNTAAVPVSGCSASGGGPVTVINLEQVGGVATGPSFTYTTPATPVITGVSPTSGPAAGGTDVTISGQNFAPPLLVTFGGAPASQIAPAATSTSVKVDAPATSLSTEACDDNGDGVPGTRQVAKTVDVAVENILTGCSKTLANAFTYTPASSACSEPPPAPVACNDGVDNDLDGFIDHVSLNPLTPDPQCTSPTDTSEAI